MERGEVIDCDRLEENEAGGGKLKWPSSSPSTDSEAGQSQLFFGTGACFSVIDVVLRI